MTQGNGQALPAGYVEIHGRLYKTVARRVQEFRNTHTLAGGWGIQTEILDISEEYVRIKATITTNDGTVIATGHAEENRVGNINEHSAVENCECVPLTVPALTPSGWKFYHQLGAGDLIAGYNHLTGLSEWTPIKAVSTFEKQAMVEIGNSRFKAICTPNHRWVIDGRLIRWSEANITGATKIMLAARPQRTAESDVDAAMALGWIFGDCTLRYTNGLPYRATITQSKEENFAELNRLFGEPVLKAAAGTREWANGTVSETQPHYAWTISSYRLRELLGKWGVNDQHDLHAAVCSMQGDELDGFCAAVLAADGARGSIYAKTDRVLCEAVQLAMFRAGHCVGPLRERAGNYMTTKPCFVVGMHKRGHKYASEFHTTTIPPQDVWCPTTELGTWVGRFAGIPAITGNTSAIGRALAAAGYGGSDTEYASAEEMLRAEHQRDIAEQRASGKLSPVKHRRYHEGIIKCVDEQDAFGLLELVEELDQAQQLWLWGQFPSWQRKQIKDLIAIARQGKEVEPDISGAGSEA